MKGITRSMMMWLFIGLAITIIILTIFFSQTTETTRGLFGLFESTLE